MTLTDPYPQDLEEIDNAALGFAPASIDGRPDPNVKALNRIATALEQIALALLDRPQNAPGRPLAALPPVQTTTVQTNGVCPIHNAPWKTVPAGVSKKTGKPYDAFQACSIAGCDQRPPR
jgi:hypothetical protein